MINTENKISDAICHKARISRDARFDGLFFTAVKTTGIYCRSICPATPPKEKNVSYYASATEAASAGYRPCLRCRPDSAPYSSAWLGNQALVYRAVKLIERGDLTQKSLQKFANYLGISDRYLRKLFLKYLGVSPKSYALYHQCLFAKQLIHQTQLPINQIAFASGFNSIRRFNDCFIKLIKITPSEIRRLSQAKNQPNLQLKLYYRPPYDWHHMQQFLASRIIPGIEDIGPDFYARTFIQTIENTNVRGHFLAKHSSKQHAFEVSIQLEDSNSLKFLQLIINNIRRILDLDADTRLIETHLKSILPDHVLLKKGLRIPGIWGVFEAGVRAILGQQVSVKAARNLVTKLAENLGATNQNGIYFPTPESIIASNLDFLKIPKTRKQCLKNLATHINSSSDHHNIDGWLKLSGIGPWTVSYAKLRGLCDPDIYLDGDSGINNAIKKVISDNHQFNPNNAAPWRSYLTFHLWSQL